MDVVLFSLSSICIASLLDLINFYGSYLGLLGWKLPNYIISSIIYISCQIKLNRSFRKNRKLNINITNFRRIVVTVISDAITMFLFNVLMSLLPLSKLGFIGYVIASYINAITVYEFRLAHIPTIKQRMRYYLKDPLYMILFGQPLAWISLHPGLSWFTIHHLYNLMLLGYISLVWHIT